MIDPPTPTMKDRVRRFIALDRRRRELEAELKLVAQEQQPLGERLREEFLQTGTQRERVDGMTVHLRFDTWARPRDGDMERLTDALQAHGFGDLVQPRVNLHTLSALVRERRKEAELLEHDVDAIFPPAVMAALDVTIDAKVRVVSGK